MENFRERVVEVTETFEQREFFIDCGDSLPTHLNVDSSIIQEGKKIGDGQYGPVHEATWLGRKVAVKKFNLSTCNMHLMAREAGFMVRLRHPNVLRLLGFSLKHSEDNSLRSSCSNQDRNCNLGSSMIMELMDSDLRKLISTRKKEAHPKGVPFMLGEAINIIAQIARGMHYLHERGYTHRDIKPDNMMVKLSHDGQVDIKIADFGCSRLMVLDPQSAAPTRAGTTQYMAPEVRNESVTQLDKADVYSFAVMCSAILIGEEPFEEVFPKRDLQTHILKGVRPLLPGDLPEEFSKLIRKCWDTDPDVRPDFKIICEVLEPLKEILGARKPQSLADIGRTLGEPAPQAQDTDFFDAIGDMPRDLYINPSEITILETIGEGAESVIHKGSWLGCQVAIKCFKAHDGIHKYRKYIERFKRLQHQNIVSFCGYCMIDNRLVVVLELMSFDLRRMIDDRARKIHDESKQNVFDDSTARDLMEQIAEGMAHMHSKGILHNDIKSSNILVSEHMEGHVVVRITDFCLCDEILGTRFWRAPEILEVVKGRDRKSVPRKLTNKSDVYSFGMLCYEILSGQIPFEDIRASDYDFVISGNRPKLPKHTSQDLVELINKCWNPNPAKRPKFSDICKILRRRH